MEETDWKCTPLGGAARAQVCAYFLNCLRLIEAEMGEEARREMQPLRWRERIDLSGVPFPLVQQTERLCSVGRLSEGLEIQGAIHRILDLW